MFAVTGSAYTRLSQMLTRYPEHVAVRIVLKQGRTKLRPGRKRPGDAVFEHEQRTVLLLDEEVAQHLEGRTLSVHTTEDGPKLRLRRNKQGTNVDR